MTRTQANWPDGPVSSSAMAYLLGMSEDELVDEAIRLGIPHDDAFQFDPYLVAMWLDEQEAWLGRS